MSDLRPRARGPVLALALASLASLALGSRMTDIGHAVGFAALAAVLAAGAAWLAWQLRR